MFVRTERLFLRPAWPEDRDDIVEALTGDDIQCTLGMAPLPGSVGEVGDYLARPHDPRLPHFFMYLRAPGGPKLVGSIGLGVYEGDVEVGYWIASRYKGRGFAGEGLRAMVEQARALGHRRMVASHFGDAPGVHQVLECAGFHDTGQVRSRYSAGRGMEHAARIYVAELERRASHRAGARSNACNAA